MYHCSEQIQQPLFHTPLINRPLGAVFILASEFHKNRINTSTCNICTTFRDRNWKRGRKTPITSDVCAPCSCPGCVITGQIKKGKFTFMVFVTILSWSM